MPEIGPFELDEAAFRLSRDGAPVLVQPKALELLILLVRAGGDVVGNDDIRWALWPDVVVTDQSLRQVVLKLREALGEHRDLVETVPRRGLRVARQPPAPRMPAERDPFVGREAELDALRAKLLAGARLVTVRGPGGVGKTRLAVRLGWCDGDEWPGGAWFCDLSGAWTVDDVAHALSRVLGIPPGRGDAVERVGHAIAGRGPCLVVLDNFEQVARHAGETVDPWLQRAPEAVFVVTSREVLGLAGEELLVLDPLTEDDAVALFVVRAAAAGAPPADGDVRALVRLLDRLPLAIELAAARARLMPVGELVERIRQRFDLVASPNRRDRHATLRTTLDWSWELLGEPERAGLVQLSVFEGGFTLEAAEAVVDVPGAWTFDVVQALIDRSWLRRAGDRFEWLATLQEYAGEQLDARGGRTRAEIRHGAWFAGLGSVRGGERGGIELANLLAACRRAVARADADIAVRAFVGVVEASAYRGPFAVAAALAEQVRGLQGLPPGLLARAAWAHGEALRICGRDGGVHFETALAAAREAGDPAIEGVALRSLGIRHAERGDTGAAQHYLEAALAHWTAAGVPKQQALSLHNLAGLAFQRGQMDEAVLHLERALALYREVGDPKMLARGLGAQAAFQRALARPADAIRSCEAALEAQRQVGDRYGEAITLRDLALAHLDLGHLDEAARWLDVALGLQRELGDRRQEAVVLGNLGRLHIIAGRPDEARVHLEAALPLAREVGDRGFGGLLLGRLGLLDARDGRFAEARARLDEGETMLRAVSHPHGVANLLVDRAEAEHLAGDADAVRRALTEATALAATAGPDSDIARQVAEAVRRLVS